MSKISSGTTTATGLVQTSDTTGNLELQTNNGTTAVTFDTNQNASFAGDVSINNGNYLSSQPTFRNLIINGDMKIAQRGTSATGLTSSGYFTCDRWRFLAANVGTWTQTQDTDVPSGQGFTSSLKMQCTTANASLTAGSNGSIITRFEGQMLQHLKKGTSNAESITMSFWVKSNKTGTYIITLYDGDNNRIIAKSYTIDTADTWEKKTITFAGDTTGAFDNDNASSLHVYMWLMAGTDYTSGTLQTTWHGQASANWAVGQVNLADSTSNYINITGVQLEVGSTATPFEHRPYDVELARCQRYYFYLDDQGGVTNQVINAGFMYDTTRGRFFVTFPTTMRTNPTIVSTNITSSIEFNLNGTGVFAPSAVLPFGASVSVNGVLLQGTADSGTGSAGESRYVRIAESGAKIEFDAEL